uniref:Uncharacterized protein n=1 Tax=Oryza brachyantha TaxID=4533 RepID=J3N0U3_ORYBR
MKLQTRKELRVFRQEHQAGVPHDAAVAGRGRVLGARQPDPSTAYAAVWREIGSREEVKMEEEDGTDMWVPCLELTTGRHDQQGEGEEYLLRCPSLPSSISQCSPPSLPRDRVHNPLLIELSCGSDLVRDGAAGGQEKGDSNRMRNMHNTAAPNALVGDDVARGATTKQAARSPLACEGAEIFMQLNPRTLVLDPPLATSKCGLGTGSMAHGGCQRACKKEEQKCKGIFVWDNIPTCRT